MQRGEREDDGGEGADESVVAQIQLEKEREAGEGFR